MGWIEYLKVNSPNTDFLEWCSRYAQETPGSVFGYRGLTKQQRCRFRKKWKKMHTHGQTVNIPCQAPPMGFYPATPSIGDMGQVELSFVWLDEYNNSQANKENNMAATDTDTYAKRDYLERRLNNTYAAKYEEAHTVFHLADDEFPKTGQDMIDRFAKGMYVYNAEAEKEAIKNEEYLEWSRFLHFRDPSKPEDRDGYRAFMQKLDTAKQLAKDTIKIADPVDGLKALHEFEAFPVQ
jgi:hypothetical protein